MKKRFIDSEPGNKMDFSILIAFTKNNFNSLPKGKILDNA